MIGYKCAKNGDTRVIITLEIPDDAITNVNRTDIVNKDTAKHRTNKAIVREIIDENSKTYETAQTSIYTKKTLTYTLNEVVEEPAFDMDLDHVCSEGIHFFLNREVAETFENPPRNRLHRDWSDSGRLYGEYTYKHGKLNGLFRNWFLNGQLHQECTYKDGKLDGPYRNWHMNGQLWAETTYKNGVYNGLFHNWYENGQLYQECTYTDGKLDGVYRSWRKNGELWEEYTYANGQRVA